MNKTSKTYQTPAGTAQGLPEVEGALYYGHVQGRYSGEWHEVAVIREDGDEVLCAGPTLFAWRKRREVVRDAD